MTDERIDALIRGLDVTSDPDPEFARSTYAALLPRARAARVRDAPGSDASCATPTGGGRCAPAIGGATPGRHGSRRPAHPGIHRGARDRGVDEPRSIQNGPLIVSIQGELQAIDPLDGSARKILPPGEYAQGVSRSPDGRLLTFWTTAAIVRACGWSASTASIDESSPQTCPLAGPTPSMSGRPTRASWRLRSMLDGGIDRIVVADVEPGRREWSLRPGSSPTTPCGRRTIAGSPSPRTKRRIPVRCRHPRAMEPAWRSRRVGKRGYKHRRPRYVVPGWRVDLLRGHRRSALSGQRSRRFHPAALRGRPGGLCAGIVSGRNAHRVHRGPNDDHWDLFVANSDGTNAHRLLEYAENDGWSADGRYVLAQWNPTDQPGGLAVVKPDGSEFRVVFPFDALCPPQPGRPANAPTASVGARLGRDG